MTAKLLFLHDFARAGAASRTRANEYLRHAAGLAIFRPPAAARENSHSRPRLECRWRIDPATGTLRARWVRIAIDRGSSAGARDIIEDRRRLRPDLAIAGGPD